MVSRLMRMSVPLLLIATTLAACGGDDAAGGGRVTITYASPVLTQPGRGPALQKWIDGFNESQTEVTVKTIPTNYSDSHTVLSTQLAAGKGPDMLVDDDSNIPGLAAAGLLMDLSSVLDSTDSLLPINDQFVIDGERYALIQEADPK